MPGIADVRNLSDFIWKRRYRKVKQKEAEVFTFTELERKVAQDVIEKLMLKEEELSNRIKALEMKEEQQASVIRSFQAREDELVSTVKFLQKREEELSSLVQSLEAKGEDLSITIECLQRENLDCEKKIEDLTQDAIDQQQQHSVIVQELWTSLGTGICQAVNNIHLHAETSSINLGARVDQDTETRLKEMEQQLDAARKETAYAIQARQDIIALNKDLSDSNKAFQALIDILQDGSADNASRLADTGDSIQPMPNADGQTCGSCESIRTELQKLERSRDILAKENEGLLHQLKGRS
ncbi:hypothetical protein HDU67_006483 [Dinochytrium kinnereticum]|nr:hypothetical protein HDU67_006483 [Dinochytrium kinnereticum]